MSSAVVVSSTDALNKVIIVGSGPAAFTAAIYAARANLAPLLLEGRIDDGHVSGGQLTTTTDVENFPGFPDGINGTELVDHMKAQCVRFGTRIEPETVASVDLSDKRVFRLRTTSGKSYAAQSIIVATGAVAKKLAFDGSETFWNRGISACAVCDGALPIFRNKALVVIGGGDTAMEEASFLSKYGSQVHIVVRRDVLRASKIMQHRVKTNPKIVFHYNAVVVEARGANNKLTTAVIEDVNTKVKTELAVGGIFFAIGHKPASDFLGGALQCDADGYIVTQPGTTQTSVPGVFAAGDVQDKKWRQAITAAGTGCMAALEVEHYLNELGE